MSDLSPNPVKAGVAIVGAMFRRRPRPRGSKRVDHGRLVPVLEALRAGGVPALADVADEIENYLQAMQGVDPDDLSRDHALAYWLNVYNGTALDLAREALAQSADSVLAIGDAFERKRLTIAGERLSLQDVEHGKVRRFKDPRIHMALVCGSISCPTLRHEPYRGDDLDAQLDDQARSFLAGGGAVRDGDRVSLSRVFRWYGADFARPGRMPTWIPAGRGQILRSLVQWMPDDLAIWVVEAKPQVTFQRYDWALGCSIR